MQLGGLDVENALVPIGRGAARLLDDEGKRAGFVEKASFPRLFLRLAG